jgi:ribose transport system permease protein
MSNHARPRPLLTTLRSLRGNQLAIAVAAIIALFLFGEIISPGFLSFGHLMSVLRLSVFLGIVALGQCLVVMAGGEGIDLSVGSVLSLGVCISSSLLLGKDSNIPAALLGSLAAGFAIGMVNGAGISYVGIPPLIMTLAMSSVVEGLSLIYTGGYPKGSAPPLLEALGSGRILDIPNMLILWLIVIIAVTIILFRKRWGAVLFGVGANSLTAELSGINVVLRTWVHRHAVSEPGRPLPHDLHCGRSHRRELAGRRIRQLCGRCDRMYPPDHPVQHPRCAKDNRVHSSDRVWQPGLHDSRGLYTAQAGLASELLIS